MQKRLRVAFLLTALAVLVVQVSLLLKDNNFAVLNPKGLIAHQQKNLFVFTILLSLVVVIPVFIMLFSIATKYNEKNTKSKYTPNWDGNKILETIWWGVPTIIILILGVATVKSTHKLDPFKAIDSSVKPLKIQVVALQWKWLFIYPEQEVASVNYFKMPVGTPVEFDITADAPMNSFWIPQLGGQIYAMSGMSTELNLVADEVGDYRGSSANLSGRGFAGMKFTASASSQTEFNSWVNSIKNDSNHKDLAIDEYKKLALPSENNISELYHLHGKNLYHDNVMKYMEPPMDIAGHRDDNSLIINSQHGSH